MIYVGKRTLFLAIGCLLSIGSVLVYRSKLFKDLDPRIRKKEQLLAQALRRKGLKPAYWIISGHRSEWFNRLLPLSARQSTHRRGLALDIWVWDVNGDWRVDREDVELCRQELERISRLPGMAGGLGTYYRSAPQMVHFDVSGAGRRWGY